jgi:branched-chain amino acid transport system permease protein
LVILIVVVSRISGGRAGRALRLVRDHETIAGTLGVHVLRTKITVFGLSSFVIGVEGALMAYIGGQIAEEQFTLLLAIQYLAMVLVGGSDSLFGAVIGATIIVSLPYLVHDLASSVVGAEQASLNGALYAQVVYGVIVTIFIVAAPEGIVGLVRTLRSRRSRRREAIGSQRVAS